MNAIVTALYDAYFSLQPYGVHVSWKRGERDLLLMMEVRHRTTLRVTRLLTLERIESSALDVVKMTIEEMYRGLDEYTHYRAVEGITV